MLRALFLSCLLSAPVAAQAPAWSGAEDPAFVEARAAWLTGANDIAALGRLADLARGGNVAAQVLLGALVAEDLVPADVAALPRAERIALTRAPGGLSGTSWLRVAAQGDPVAQALEMAAFGWQQSAPADMVAPLETLLDAGETGAAFRIITVFYNMGGLGPEGGWSVTTRLAGHPALQGHGHPLLQGVHDILSDPLSGVADPDALNLVKAALDELPPSGDLAAPLAAFCAAGCPVAPDACTGALVRTVGGLTGLLTLSPVEGLIDSATYRASPRFATDLRARLSEAVDFVAERDACAASLLR